MQEQTREERPMQDVARSVLVPFLFDHDLDPALFAPDRLDWLCRRAEKLDHVDVQLADPGRERPGNLPHLTHARYPVVDDVLDRALQYRIYEPAQWGGDEYRQCLERVFEIASLDLASSEPLFVTSVVRVFTPGAIVALHGDPDLKLVCDVSGETIWHVRHPSEMTVRENENLLRGEFFLRWRDAPEQALPIPPGTGCFVPSRWAHWLEHPCEEPVVSFELGFWTVDSLRRRKIYDVNWLLRRLRLDPKLPGEGRDGLKCRFFDLTSTVTRKGLQYRGV
jgi:hypothetical protein